MAVTTCRHGTQPESPAALPAPTRHLALVATGFEPFDHHQNDAGPGHRGMGQPPKPCACGAAINNIAPRRKGGHDGRPSGRLGLAARPDQVVRAVLVLDQAGIDRHRERRIVEGYGHVGPPGFAGLLPPCADVVAGRLKAEVGALSFSPLALATSLTLTLSVRVRSVPVKPSFSAVKVPMFAMMNFLSVEQGSRPSRPVVIRPATARIHKQTGRLGPTRSERNMADSASRVTASPACALARARTTPSDKVKAPDVAGGLLLEAWRGSAIARPGGVSVNRPS